MFLRCFSVATLTLFSAQALAAVSIHAVDSYAQEGVETAALRISREVVTDTALMVYLDYSGTASAADVETQPASIDFAAGQVEALIVMNPVRDGLSEGTESLTVSISPDASYTIERAQDTIYVRDEGYVADGIVAPLSETFNLHSKPGADHIIYLNFKGGNYSWTWDWENDTDYVSPYDKDGDNTTYSDAERAEIQKIWQAVAEDYRPFNINVTTEEPADKEDALTKLSESDTTWGVELLVGPDPGYGFAWSGSLFWDSSQSYPGYVSMYFNGSFLDTAVVAAGASHEVGHTLGLNHDGDTSNEYYDGHITGNYRWTAIMGTSYPGLSQWNNGSYPNASNTSQDDLAIISNAQNGFGYRVDDHADDAAYATPLSKLDDGFNSLFAEGIIETNTDIDWFTFNHPGGDLLLDITPGSFSPNLDIDARLYDQNMVLVASGDRTANLTAGFNTTLTAGTYYVSVEGVGSSEGLGYPDYGSLGEYTISSGLGELAFYDPVREAANEPIAGSTQFSSVTISDLTAVGLGSNTGSNYWPLYWDISNTLDPNSYISFTIEAPNLKTVRLDLLTVSFYSFGDTTLRIRSSLDNFASDIDQATLSRYTYNVATLDLSSVVGATGAIEFRLYMTGVASWQYLTGTGYYGGTGLTLTGRVVSTDTAAPVVSVPADITVAAVDANGTPATNSAISTFLGAATANDDVDGSVTVTHDAPATFPLGVTTVTFSATDVAGNEGTGSATVTVEDQTAPVITLSGSTSVTIFAGSTYTEAGARASDNVDGAISGNIVITGTVDTATPGTYTLHYNVSDAAGNAAAEVTRTVNVVFLDEDGDGMPNYWENQYGLNPLDASDALSDPDEDGLNNLEEYEGGTNPVVYDSLGGLNMVIIHAAVCAQNPSRPSCR